MDIQEIRDKIAKHELIPIHVTNGIDGAERSALWVDGDLDTFLESCKHIGARAIFFQFLDLYEDLFFADPTEIRPDRFHADDEYDDESGEDLTKVEPKLKPFKQHIGDHMSVTMMCITPEARLYYMDQEPWGEGFAALRSAAIETLQNGWQARLIELEEEQEAKEREEEEREERALKPLDSLLKDETFCTLTTQAEMFEYAIEEFPEIKDLHPEAVRDKIKILANKVKVAKKRLKARKK
ncbi:MAG: hypothetical protein KDH09_18990 [Chrysiogenetes bacterium]|nr:hypothetical protein [Chrysiogenetes bacterium]